MNCVFPDPIDLLPGDRDALMQLGQMTFYDDTPGSEAATIERVQQAEIIAPSWVDISAGVIAACDRLKYIIVPAVGYDQIDVDAATQAGIAVINCPTHNADAVAEYTVGLIFAITRHMLQANLALRQQQWEPIRFKGTELRGKTLTLVGYGNSGQATGKLAAALGMKVNWTRSHTSPEELDQAIATADILSLHLPLTPQSYHLIDARRLALMQPSAYLINTARGAIVDPEALTQALRQGQLAGAALDVFENEPVIGAPSPQIQALVQLDNVVATPHIAYNTTEMVQRLGAELSQNIQACMAGQPINRVNLAS